MASGALTPFQEFVGQLGSAKHNFDSDTLKLGLVDDVLTPTAADATPTWSDYVANEVGTGGGYTANGLTLASVTWGEVDGTGTLDAANIALAQDASGFTNARWGILYNDTEATDMAIAFVDLGSDRSEVAGAVNINWNASGVVAVAVS